MSRPAIVAAFIAGVALAATIVVLASPQQPVQPSLSEKLAQLSHFAAADRHAKHFTQGLDATCTSVPSGSNAGPNGCGGEPGDYLFQDGCCYKKKVCYLPSMIYCKYGPDRCEQPKRLPGSEAGVNYKAGWALPIGCISTCADNGQECG